MQELRLVRADLESASLILATTRGEQYSFSLTPELLSQFGPESSSADRTTALNHSTPDPSASPAMPAARLTPREIQAQIRSGASVAQVCEQTGSEQGLVERFAAPILAEREHLARLAQGVIVAEGDSALSGNRQVFGDAQVSLLEMSTHQLDELGAEPHPRVWDAYKSADGRWNITLSFSLEAARLADIASEFPVDPADPTLARWIFRPSSKALANANQWARILSELEPVNTDSKLRHLNAVTGAVPPSSDDNDSPAHEQETGDAQEKATHSTTHLLDVLMGRRGQRLGADEISDDTLALMLSQGPIPGARGDQEKQPGEDNGQVETPADGARPNSAREELESPQNSKRRGLLGQLRFRERAEDDDAITLQDNFGQNTQVIEFASRHAKRLSQKADKQGASQRAEDAEGVGAEGNSTSESPVNPADPAERDRDPNTSTQGRTLVEEEPAEENGQLPLPSLASGAHRQNPSEDREGGAKGTPLKRSVRPNRRSSVPSWDEIVFGTKSE